MFEDIDKQIAQLSIETRAFIDGEYIVPSKMQTIKKYSSIDARELAALYAYDEEDVDKAVSAALKSYNAKVWRDSSVGYRRDTLLKLADLVEENIEELALLDTIETGRSLKNYYYDSLPKAIEAMRWFAQAVDKLQDVALPPSQESFGFYVREPLGVVGIITPWNDPLVVDFWKLTPALLMGNSVVLKPAEQASYSILKVAQLAVEAGIPKGVFNVVPGYGHIAGKALALHNDVRGIFFTGSSEVGKKILQYSGESNMKKVGLECGGKSPFVVSASCKNLQEAALVLAKNIFYNQGQICSAPSRLIIDATIKERFVELLKQESQKYKPCNPLSLESEVGGVVSTEQKERIEGFIDEGKQRGYTMYTFNEELPNEKGNYIFPTIFDGVDDDSSLLKDEIFGPVLVIETFNSIDEAIEKANNTKYGLAASIWSGDMQEVYRISRALEAGIVHVNSYGEDDIRAPFGGIKESGLGKDKSLLAFDEYSHIKTIWMKFS